MGIFLATALASPASARYASIVVDSMTGQVLYEVNADTRNYPASLTKMMTLYMAFEALEDGRLRLDQSLKVSRRAARQPPSKLGLKRNQRITVKQAILALVTKSANDVAVVLAEALGRTERKFAQQMNKKAQLLGMKRTNFRNASGLPNRRQLSTARDMAKLVTALIRHYPQYYSFFSAKTFRYRGRTHTNHNTLLTNYDGTDGLKTGYTRASGYNLAASTVRDGRRLVAVVFGGRTARSRDKHITALLEKGFSKPIPLVSHTPGSKPGKLIAVGAPAVKQKSRAKFARGTSGMLPVPQPKPEALLTARRAGSQLVETVSMAGRWGVQVGAFYRVKPAENAASKAARKLPKILGGTQVLIRKIKGRKGLLYRAQLIGLSEKQARLACRQLKSAKIDCMVVRGPKKLKVALNNTRGS
ncbi:MAG: D-alanyl-D-alanine carboxypeptidase [Kiloniellales bacterium]|nr:D-alanyl-D-alanine carboxypeptidase [Kiloniellales bacterium]